MNVGILANLLATYGNSIFHSICVFYFLSWLFIRMFFFSSFSFELDFSCWTCQAKGNALKKLAHAHAYHTYIKQRGQNGKVCNIKSRPMEKKKLTTLN